MARDRQVPNAFSSEKWKNNPDIKLDMISYLGFPILFPDGKAFGTICVLDHKENAYSDTFESLMRNFREIIQTQLHLLFMNSELGDKNKALSDYLEEIKILRGIIPICSFCKNIRDDKGDWEPVEEYVASHSEADFSHSVCPKCLVQQYDMPLKEG